MKSVKDVPWREFVTKPARGGTKTLRVEDVVTLVASAYHDGQWFLVINNRMVSNGWCKGWFRHYRAKRMAMFAVMSWLGCHGYNLEV